MAEHPSNKMTPRECVNEDKQPLSARQSLGRLVCVACREHYCPAGVLFQPGSWCVVHRWIGCIACPERLSGVKLSAVWQTSMYQQGDSCFHGLLEKMPQGGRWFT